MKGVSVSVEVAAVLRAHFSKRLKVYGSYSNPTGDCPLGNGRPTMKTIWDVDDSHAPFLEIVTTWERGHKDWERVNEQSEYWIYIPTEEVE